MYDPLIISVPADHPLTAELAAWFKAHGYDTFQRPALVAVPHPMTDQPAPPPLLPFTGWAWPTEVKGVNQRFRERPEVYSKFIVDGKPLPGHEGWDLPAPDGSGIFAVLPGTVYEVANRGNYGIHVRVQHDRHEGGYKTVYAHLKKALVSVGQQVTRGQRLGDADSTGNSTGSHLHLTLKKDGATERGETDYPSDIVDPGPWLDPLLAPTLPYQTKVKARRSVIVRDSAGQPTGATLTAGTPVTIYSRPRTIGGQVNRVVITPSGVPEWNVWNANLEAV